MPRSGRWRWGLVASGVHPAALEDGGGASCCGGVVRWSGRSHRWWRHLAGALPSSGSASSMVGLWLRVADPLGGSRGDGPRKSCDEAAQWCEFWPACGGCRPARWWWTRLFRRCGWRRSGIRLPLSMVMAKGDDFAPLPSLLRSEDVMTRARRNPCAAVAAGNGDACGRRLLLGGIAMALYIPCSHRGKPYARFAGPGSGDVTTSSPS